MKINNLIIFTLFFVLSNSAWGAISCDIDDPIITYGTSTTLRCDAGENLNGVYKIKYSVDGGVSSFTLTTSDTRDWSRAFGSSASIGSHTIIFKLYKVESSGPSTYLADITSKVLTVNPSPLDPPSGVSATDGTSTDKVIITWNSVTGADSNKYQVYYSQYSSSGYTLLNSATSSPYNHTSATEGITYYYKIKAYNSTSGASELSTSYDSGYKGLAIPNVISKGANPNPVYVNQPFKIYCNFDSSLPTGYKVKVGINNTTTNFVLSEGTSTNLEKGFVYGTIGTHTIYYKLYDELGNYKKDLGSSTFTVNSSLLDPPTGVSATDGTSTDKVIITWNSVTGADSNKYQVYYSQNSSSGYTLLNSATSSPYNHTSATAGITYYYKIKAYNSSSGASELSASYDMGYRGLVISSVSDVNPKSVTSGISQTFTVNGSNFPNTIALSLAGSPSCNNPFDITSTSAKVTCTPGTTGNQRFYVATQSGGAAISGSTSLYVNVSSPIDNPPVVTINTVGSSPDNNPKTADFDINLSITDDIGLNVVAYEVFTSSSASTGQIDNVNLAGTSDTATFTIDLDSLAVGSYKVKITASDTKPQASVSQWYWFQKINAAHITSLEITNAVFEYEYNFTATLNEPLEAGQGVFLNFDNQQGGWLLESEDSGHIQLTHQGGNVYSHTAFLSKTGIRFIRAGVFDSNNIQVGSYSDPATCTLSSCLEAVARPKNNGNHAVTGSGSELFKNIDVADGNYHLSTADMSVSAKGPSFSFSRAYNSNHASPWTFAYEMKASFADSYNREIAIGPREDGHIQYFFKDMADQWHSINPGDFDQLVENADNSFTLYTQGNRLYQFNPAGRLLSIDDRLGNSLDFEYISNNLTRVIDANGRIYTISRDANNRIQRVTDFSGRYINYTYDANNMITEVRKMRGDAYKEQYTYTNGTYLQDIIDPRNNRQLTIQYTSDGRVEKLIDGNNEETSFLYGSNAQWGVYTAVTQPVVDTLNHNRVYILNSGRTRVEKMYDAKSASDAINNGDIVTTRSYKTAVDNTRFSDLGLVTQIDDPKNNSTAIVYDELVGRANPETITDAKAQITKAVYTAVNNQQNLTPVTTLTQKAKVPGDVDIITQYQDFTPTGKARTIIDAENHISNRLFDGSTGNITQSTNARNNVTNYNYDVYGNVIQINQVVNTGNIVTTQIYYNETDSTQLGRLKTEISPLGLSTTYTYDEQGNVETKRESDEGSINYLTQYFYDASDNLSYTLDPLLNRTDYSYDILNRKIQESYMVGGVLHTRSYAYDALGRLATVTNELNQSSHTHYTARSKVSYKVNPLNLTTVTYTYDKNDNVATITDAENRIVTISYDELNRKIKMEDLKGYQSWTYNTAGLVASYRDRRGQITTYEYDKVGNLKKLIDPEGGITRSSYDGNGNLLTVTDPNQHITTYTYDQLDRRTRTTLHNGQYWDYTYDVNGNLLTETTPTGEKTTKVYDALNRVIQLTEQASNTSVTRQISYSYDANNNVTAESSGGNTISYTYDEINRVKSVTDRYGKTISYGYDKAGNRTILTYPGNKTISYSYDNADRLHSLTDWLNKTTTYTRNKAGQPTQVVNGNGTKTDYIYDTVGRLTQLNNLKANNSVISSHNLTLDGSGNITRAVVNLPLSPLLPQSINGMNYDNNNRILGADSKTYTHDGTGRIIEQAQNGTQTIYNFDINDHISSITQGGATLSNYGYDLNNNRISQTQNGTETRYVIDPLASLPNVVAETDDLGNVSHYYIYGEGLVSQIDSNNNSHYYHYDPTGHTLALTDASGNITDKYAYAPYGYTTIQGTTHNPFKYVGKHGVMDDGNGLHYMRARYYKEDIKRFLSLDGLHGDMLSPQALNRYAYVLGNPIMGIDPSGREKENVSEGAFLTYFEESMSSYPIWRWIYWKEVKSTLAERGEKLSEEMENFISSRNVIDLLLALPGMSNDPPTNFNFVNLAKKYATNISGTDFSTGKIQEIWEEKNSYFEGGIQSYLRPLSKEKKYNCGTGSELDELLGC